MSNQEELKKLYQQFNDLTKKHNAFGREINDMRSRIVALENSIKFGKNEPVLTPQPQSAKHNIEKTDEPELETKSEFHFANTKRTEDEIIPHTETKREKKASRNQLERFIGENLVSKIGILVLFIGVIIGVKYSIEHDLISPVTRIVLGYVTGISLLLVGMKLRAKYQNYSAVLVSGAMAVMYIVTFAAYDFYEVIPIGLTFALMVLFTAFTVTTSLFYKKPSIAYLGLVGAYAVPFLLSTGSGNYPFLFSYMLVINIGILAISFKQKWHLLHGMAFVFSWMIFGIWFAFDFNQVDLNKGFIFLTSFFVLFYLMAIAHSVIAKKKMSIWDILMMVFNALIYFGLGYEMLDHVPNSNQVLAIFALANAIVHFGVSVLIFKKKLAEQTFFYLTSAFVLLFIGLAVVILFDGHWVTVCWSGIGLIYFWIGRTKGFPIYEKLALPILTLSLFSLFQDWARDNPTYLPSSTEEFRRLLLSSKVFSSCLVLAVMIGVYVIHRNTASEEKERSTIRLQHALSMILPGIILGILYLIPLWEIQLKFRMEYASTIIPSFDADHEMSASGNQWIMTFRNLVMMMYTMVFVGIGYVINRFKVQNKNLNLALLIFSGLVIFVFLFEGLMMLSNLREEYLRGAESLFKPTQMYITIRYISLAVFALFVGVIYRFRMKWKSDLKFKQIAQFLLSAIVLWVLTSEWIHIMDMNGSGKSYKMGLTILWGFYALILVAIGFAQKKQFLRITAIVIFGITLLKLVFYDLADMTTIRKTVVLISLGVFLLLISFLYNRFASRISEHEE